MSIFADQEWQERKARIRERLTRTDEIQRQWRENPMGSATLMDASKALCDPDAPPPTTEELLWLKENLIQHQQSVEKLIQLVEALLEHQNRDA